MTQNKDTYRFKGRAIFLAAIMVISVLAMPLAFAGGAAAQANSITPTNIDDVAAGASADYQNVSFTVDIDQSESDEVIVDLSNATDADAEPFLSSVESSEENVSVSGDINNDDELVISVDASEDFAGGNVDITANLVHELADVDPVNGVEVGIENEDGSITDQVTFNVSGVDVEASNRAYEGQFIQALNGSSSGEDIELIRDPGDDDEFIDVEQADNDGFVFFDTEGLETGETYAFVNESGDTLGEIQLTANRYSAEWDEDEVDNAGDTTVDVELDANRGSYTVQVTADDLDSDEIFEIFEDSSDNAVESDDGVVLFDIRDGDFEADFDDIDAGDYDFEFDMVDTVATDSSSITVSEGEDGDLAFAEDSVTSRRVTLQKSKSIMSATLTKASSLLVASVTPATKPSSTSPRLKKTIASQLTSTPTSPVTKPERSSAVTTMLKSTSQTKTATTRLTSTVSLTSVTTT